MVYYFTAADKGHVGDCFYVAIAVYALSLGSAVSDPHGKKN